MMEPTATKRSLSPNYVQPIQQKKFKSTTFHSSQGTYKDDPQEGPSPKKIQPVFSKQTKPTSMEISITISAKYPWTGNSAKHGITYKKDLAMALFVAASIEEHSFRLTTQIKHASKFDDAVLILDNLKEVWFFGVKHCREAPDVNAAIKFNDLFPANFDKINHFSLPMYIQSYLNILQMGEFNDFNKRFFIFTNKNLDEREKLEKFIGNCKYTPNNKLEESIADKCWEKFAPMVGKIDELLEKMNIIPFALRDAIIELIKFGKVSKVLTKYSTPLQSILQIENNFLNFSRTFTKSNVVTNQKWLYNELRKYFIWKQDGKIKTISGKIIKRKVNVQIKQLFRSKSNENTFPIIVKEKDLELFFNSLIICTNQPCKLSTIRDKCISRYIDDWVYANERNIFSDRTNFLKIFESEFKAWIEDSITKKAPVHYLSSSDGNNCLDKIKADM